MLKEIFELDDYEADQAITDGAMDKGMDAIFEQESSEGGNVLYVVQSKYFDNFDKSIDESAINKAMLAVENYVLGGYAVEGLNKRLQPKAKLYQEKLRKGAIDMVSLIFVSNGAPMSQNLISELDKFKKRWDGQVEYEIYSEKDLSRVFVPPSAIPVREIDLKVVKELGSGDKTFIHLPALDAVEGRVVRVDVCELARIVGEYPNIFSSNVRAYQSIRNKVNKAIAETLRDEEKVELFIYLNNGITFLCDDFEFKPGNEVVIIKKPSIINGCQTASTVLEVYDEGKLIPNTSFVIARIIKSKSESVKEAIIISSNTQTAVRDRDLVSDCQIQKELETQFETLGYYYARKRGSYRDKPEDRVIDLEKAAQYYLSLYLEKPADAKMKKKEIYNSYYERVFNRELTAQQLLVGYLLFRKINARVKELCKERLKDKKSVLGNSILHLLPLFKIWILAPLGKLPSDLEDDLSLIDKLVDRDNIDKIIARVVDSIQKISTQQEGDFNVQYFFRAPDSLDAILGRKTRKGMESKEKPRLVELNSRNIARQKDLRYYKPERYSVNGGSTLEEISHWNDLFVTLMNMYLKKSAVGGGNLDFIDSGTRILLVASPDSEERKLRKKLSNDLWLLTNFDAKYLSRFCFNLAQELGIELVVSLRPTRYRVEGKYKKKRTGRRKINRSRR